MRPLAYCQKKIAHFLVVLTLLTFNQSARAQSLSVGSDLSPWFLDGYSLNASVEAEALGKWRLGTEIWSFDFPEFAIELQEENRGEDWNQHVHVGLVFYADWHFTEEWHIGILASGFDSTVTRDNVPGEDSFWSVELLGRGGYRWFPGQQEHFYINPFLAAGPVIRLGESRSIGGEFYQEPFIQMIGTVHAGWRF